MQHRKRCATTILLSNGVAPNTKMTMVFPNNSTTGGCQIPWFPDFRRLVTPFKSLSETELLTTYTTCYEYTMHVYSYT